MINGIMFKILNKRGKYLFDILKDIDVIKYEWYIRNDEIYYDQDYKDLFDNNKINGKELYKRILIEDYYIINIQLMGYKEKSDYKEIEVYDDFKNSTCEIMLCIIDSIYCEIYLKDESLIKKLYKSLDEKNFNPIYITEKNLRNKVSIF